MACQAMDAPSSSSPQAAAGSGWVVNVSVSDCSVKCGMPSTSVDRVPVHVTGEPDDRHAGLAQHGPRRVPRRDRSSTSGLSLEVVVAGLGVPGDRDMARDDQRPVGAAHDARPATAGRASVSTKPPGPADRASARHSTSRHPPRSIGLRWPGSGRGRLVVGDREMVEIVVAADVDGAARRSAGTPRPPRARGRRSLGRSRVGDAVAEVDHGIGRASATKRPNSASSGSAADPFFVKMVVAVMDIGDEREADGWS